MSALSSDQMQTETGVPKLSAEKTGPACFNAEKMRISKFMTHTDIKVNNAENIPLKTSFRTIEFTPGSLLPAAAADIDSTDSTDTVFSGSLVVFLCLGRGGGGSPLHG